MLNVTSNRELPDPRVIRQSVNAAQRKCELTHGTLYHPSLTVIQQRLTHHLSWPWHALVL